LCAGGGDTKRFFDSDNGDDDDDDDDGLDGHGRMLLSPVISACLHGYGWNGSTWQ
jgi:hypothetical protein